MATPAPPPHPFAPKFEFAFTVSIDLTAPIWLKPTSMGATRAAIWAAQGTFEGPRIKGRVIPMSGGDYPLVRPNGVIDFDARYLLEADDGTMIYMMNRSYRHAPPATAARMEALDPVEPSEYYMRVMPTFETPVGKHDWLTRTIIVGSAERRSDHSIFDYYAVL